LVRNIVNISSSIITIIIIIIIIIVVVVVVVVVIRLLHKTSGFQRAVSPAGRMDTAMEYIRRCLFVLEAAYCESYRPAEGGTCRLDATRRENRAFFIALFRHMQMVGTGG
jgi:hypothetical protein